MITIVIRHLLSWASYQYPPAGTRDACGQAPDCSLPPGRDGSSSKVPDPSASCWAHIAVAWGRAVVVPPYSRGSVLCFLFT